MERQQLLAQRLVARQQQAARIAAGVGLAQQLEERHHVLIVGDDAVELLEQIEDDVGLPVGDRAAQLGQAVEHADAAHLVAGLAQRRDHVVLGAPLLDFLVAVALRGSPGGTRLACTTTSVRSFFIGAGAESRPGSRAARAARASSAHRARRRGGCRARSSCSALAALDQHAQHLMDAVALDRQRACHRRRQPPRPRARSSVLARSVSWRRALAGEDALQQLIGQSAADHAGCARACGGSAAPACGCCDRAARCGCGCAPAARRARTLAISSSTALQLVEAPASRRSSCASRNSASATPRTSRRNPRWDAPVRTTPRGDARSGGCRDARGSAPGTGSEAGPKTSRQRLRRRSR